MIEKVKKFLKNNYKLIIFYIIFILLFTIKLDYQIYTPGGLINLDKRIEIKNSYESKGSFNLTYVGGKAGTIPIILLSYIIPSWDLIPLEESQIENESISEINLRNKIYLNEINNNAIIVAFKASNKKYEINNNDVIVIHKMDNSKTNLKAGDVIYKVEGIKVDNIKEITDIVNKYNIGDKIKIDVKRKNKNVECYAYIKEVENNNKIIGLYIMNDYDIKTNPEVKFKFKNSEMGPSGGLMTTLKIYDMLNKEDITKGMRISGTGTIEDDGTVGEISGIKYKLSGSVRKKADIFICPSGNYKEAIKLKEKMHYKIKIIEAKTFEGVLKDLNSL